MAEKFNLDKSLIGKTTYEEYVKGKARLPKLADIRSKKNNFWKMKTFEEGLDEIKIHKVNKSKAGKKPKTKILKFI